MRTFYNLFQGRLGRANYALGNLIILGIGQLAVRIYPNILLSFFFTLLVLPLCVRRLHDIGLPGYLAFIVWFSYLGTWALIIGGIFSLFILFKKGDDKTNKYGEKPLQNIKLFDAIINKTHI